METTLYKRNAQGKPIQWSIHKGVNNVIIVKYGIIKGNIHEEAILPTQQNIDKEILSLINSKRKEGYKTIEDLYDNSPIEIYDEQALYDYLNTYLPKFNTHEDGKFIPMLCKTLKDNKPFEKGNYFGQWKINGERCIITATKTEDLFGNVTLHYRSREGVDWTQKLAYLDDYIIPCLKGDILDMMVEEGVGLDGELYIPGYGINDINSFIKNTDMPQHYQLQYWCYDLCIENMSAIKRQITLQEHQGFYRPNILSKEDHLNNKHSLVLLPNTFIEDITKATQIRDKFIEFGFEGLVIREEDTEYQFGGKRNNSMLKYKKIEDGWFNIIAIKEDKRGLPIFTLKNDLNDETFDATYNAPQEVQRMWLYLKEETYSTYKCLVEYRERSGVKQVPFHSKIVVIEKK